MSDDFKPLPKRHGGLIGRNNENSLLNNAGGPDGIVTRVRSYPDGTTTRMKTRAGFPEFVTEKKKTPPTATSRTFVFRHIGEATGVVANKFGAGMKLVATGVTIGSEISYWVGKLVTDVQGFWKDVVRRDGTGIVRNGLSPTPVINTVPASDATTFPVVVGGAYAATCTGDATRSTMRLVKGSDKQVVNVSNTGATHSTNTAADQTVLNSAGLHGRGISVTGPGSYLDVTFYGMHRERLNSVDPMNPLYYQSTATRMISETLRLTNTAPYTASLDVVDEYLTAPSDFTTTTVSTTALSGAHIPATRRAAAIFKKFQVLPGGAVGYSFDRWEDYTSSRSEPETFVSSRLPAGNVDVVLQEGTKYEVRFTATVTGTNTASGGAGRLYMSYGASPEVNVWAGHSGTTTFDMTGTVKCDSKAGVLYKRTEHCACTSTHTEESWMEQPAQPVLPAPPGGSTEIGEEAFEVVGSYSTSYESAPTPSLRLSTVTIEGRDYAFYDHDEDVGVGIHTSLTYSQSVEATCDTSPTATYETTVTNAVLTVSLMVRFHGVEYLHEYFTKAVTVPVGTNSSHNTMFSPAWPIVLGSGAVSAPSCGSFSATSLFSSVQSYYRDALYNTASFGTGFFNAPPYSTQFNCPWIAYTTKEEEARGAVPEVYVDGLLLAKKPMDYEHSVPEALFQSTPFVATNFLRISSEFGPLKGYELWSEILPSGAPIKVQFANGEFGNWQSKLGPGFTGHPQLEITRI